MDRLNFLKEKYLQYPTVMDIKVEIQFIKELKDIPERVIFDNSKIFFDLLDILEESHQNGGIFEVTDDNLFIFTGFSNWIRKINKFFKLERLEYYSSDFEGKFDD